MKTSLAITLMALFATTSSISQEIYAKQYWALVGDSNADNWVDPGDTISITVDISSYDMASPVISLHNKIEHPYLELLSGSVSTLSGTISQGNHRDDHVVMVEDIELNRAIGEGLVTFRCVVKVQPADTPIEGLTNFSSIQSSLGTTLTNQINIPVKTLAMVSTPSNIRSIMRSNIFLIWMAIAGVSLGFSYQRIKRTRLSLIE